MRKANARNGRKCQWQTIQLIAAYAILRLSRMLNLFTQSAQSILFTLRSIPFSRTLIEAFMKCAFPRSIIDDIYRVKTFLFSATVDW